MSRKYYRLSGIVGLGGLLFLLYQSVTTLSQMNAGPMMWDRLSILDVAGAKWLEWMGHTAILSAGGLVQYFLSLPVSTILLVLSLLLFLAGFMSKK